jgi:hypothetical protein
MMTITFLGFGSCDFHLWETPNKIFTETIHELWKPGRILLKYGTLLHK